MVINSYPVLLDPIAPCEWSTWSSGLCSKTCNTGQQIKKRIRVKSEDACVEEGKEEQQSVSCNTQKCPGMSVILNKVTHTLNVIYYYCVEGRENLERHLISLISFDNI